MSERVTMQVGPLELRKTDEGWQYLCEGVGDAPDQWCEASSVLGPFGGSGVNHLLDELAATKAHAEAREYELVEALKDIRGRSSCCDVWDHIDTLVPFDSALYS